MYFPVRFPRPRCTISNVTENNHVVLQHRNLNGKRVIREIFLGSLAVSAMYLEKSAGFNHLTRLMAREYIYIKRVNPAKFLLGRIRPNGRT